MRFISTASLLLLFGLTGCGNSVSVDTLHPAASLTLRIPPSKQEQLFDLLASYGNKSNFEFVKSDMPPKDGRKLVNVGLKEKDRYALVIDNLFAADEYGVDIYPMEQAKVEPSLITLLNQLIELSDEVIKMKKCDSGLLDCENITIK